MRWQLLSQYALLLNTYAPGWLTLPRLAGKN
jgi:hypothetical protein